MNNNTCLIIGDGISGLLAGNSLQHNGFQVTIIDKGKGIGGRLASRRIINETYGTGVFDYGVQFYSQLTLQTSLHFYWKTPPNGSRVKFSRFPNRFPTKFGLVLVRIE